MKALSVKQPWASLINTGEKTIETRTWSTKYRGDVLICSSQKPIKEFNCFHKTFPNGVALCVAELYDVKPMIPEHEKAACCEVYPKAKSWFFKNIRPVEPFKVKGMLGIFEIECTPRFINKNSSC